MAGMGGRGHEGLKRRLGCWLHERWRLECALCPILSRLTGIRWYDLHNRIERIGVGGDAASRVCRWQWTSELTVCQVFPEVGARLLRHCVESWPLLPAGTRDGEVAPPPRISVIIPVGAEERHAALRAVLASFLGQTEPGIEVIVAEQSSVPRLEQRLPLGVRYLHITDAAGEAGFNKSRLMNAAARQSRAPWLLFHDGDIVVPAGYVAAILERVESGPWEALRPIRFLFCLDSVGSERYLRSSDLPAEIARVTQNFPGGSTAVRRDVYWALGGHDERFVGWGGEDTEFLDRLRTRRLFPGHFAPALHLWHPPAPKKRSGDRNQAVQDARLSISAEERIRELRVRMGCGDPVSLG